jgi:hypothetical protein
MPQVRYDRRRGIGHLRLVCGGCPNPPLQLGVANDHEPPLLHVERSWRLDRRLEEFRFFGGGEAVDRVMGLHRSPAIDRIERVHVGSFHVCSWERASRALTSVAA